MTHKGDPFLHPTDLNLLTNILDQWGPTFIRLGEPSHFLAGEKWVSKMGLSNERKIRPLRSWDMGLQGGPRIGFRLFQMNFLSFYFYCLTNYLLNELLSN